MLATNIPRAIFRVGKFRAAMLPMTLGSLYFSMANSVLECYFADVFLLGSDCLIGISLGDNAYKQNYLLIK